MEFREGFCGWDNTKKGSRYWKQATKQEMERLTLSNPGSGEHLLFNIVMKGFSGVIEQTAKLSTIKCRSNIRWWFRLIENRFLSRNVELRGSKETSRFIKWSTIKIKTCLVSLWDQKIQPKKVFEPFIQHQKKCNFSAHNVSEICSLEDSL